MQFQAGKYPRKNLAILSCMDTRLTRLLPEALGLKNGDAILIKNAGGVVTHSCGSVVRSLLVAILELGVTDIMVIGHTDCGVQSLHAEKMIRQMKVRGISTEQIEAVKFAGVDFYAWLAGFETPETSVSGTVKHLKSHPLIPKDISITGYVMDSDTGKLSAVMDGPF